MNKYTITVLIFLSVLGMNGNNSEAGVGVEMEALFKSKEQIKKSVVKITSKNNQGTGFIVGLVSDTAYILTVSHVVANDSAPNVEFFGQTKEFKAKVLETEGQQENGFALLTVTESIPSDSIPLYVANKFDLEQGDSVFAFGFPRSGGDWAYDDLSYSSNIAREILFSGSDMQEGNSGSPLIKGDKVVGMVTSVTNFAHANSAESIREFLRGAKGGSIVLEHMEKWRKVTMPKPETSDIPAVATHSEEKAPKEPSNGLIMAIDEDGVPDYRDLCPRTPRGAKVDENGCEYVTKGCDFILSTDVAFGFDKSDLTPQGRDTVAALAARIMKSLPSIESIVVIGHTDSIGSDAYNQKLSERRANTVADFLVSSGVPAAKVFFSKGRGETEPVDDNTTKEGRAKNRRIQITIGQGKDCSGAVRKQE